MWIGEEDVGHVAPGKWTPIDNVPSLPTTSAWRMTDSSERNGEMADKPLVEPTARQDPDRSVPVR